MGTRGLKVSGTKSTASRNHTAFILLFFRIMSSEKGVVGAGYRFFLLVFFFFGLFAISWAALVAYGGSQARGRIGATTAGLHQSHGNTRSKPCLQPTPQLMAVPDP